MTTFGCHIRKRWLFPLLVLFAVRSGSGSAPAQDTKTAPDTAGSGENLVLKRQGKDEFADVRALAFSPDSKALASGHEDALVLVWDVLTGKEIVALREHKQAVRTLAFSPDGKLLATGSNDGTIKLWAWGPADADPPRGKMLASLEGHRREVLAVAFSPDGKTLASGGLDGSVRLWDVAGRKERASLDTGNWSRAATELPGNKPGPRPACAVAFSPNGLLVGAVCADVARVWDAATGREKATLGPAISGYATLVVGFYMVGQPGWDHPNSAGVAFTRDNKSLVTSWSHQSRNPLPNSGGPLGPGLGLNLPSDCAPLKVWDLTTRRPRSMLPFRQVEVTHVDPSTKRMHRTGHGSEGIGSFAYSPDGKMLVTGGSQYPITGRETRFDDIMRISKEVGKNPNDYYYVVKLWDMSKGRQLAVLKGHRDYINAVAFAPNGALVASAGRDTPAGRITGSGIALGSIRLWDVARATADNSGK